MAQGAQLRRLISLLWTIALVQGLFFSALAPLLPSFEAELGLTKAQAGVLVGTLGVGQVLAAIPMGALAARIGTKPSALLGVVLFAVASLGFGHAASYESLLGARLLQGAAAALCFSSGLAWLVSAAASERRGEMIALLSAARAAGQMVGPVVGAIAVAVGRAATFTGTAVLTLLLALAGTRLPGVGGPGRMRFDAVFRAHRSADIWLGQWLVLLPGILLGTTFVLVPLRLDHLGMGSTGVAATFLVAAGIGVITRSASGRWADTRGLRDALGLMLTAAVPLTLVLPWVQSPLVLAGLVVCVISVYGGLIGPSMALVSHAYDRAGVAHVVAFAFTGLASSIGVVLGSTASGSIANVAGDRAAYGLGAVACLTTACALTLGTRRARIAAAPE